MNAEELNKKVALLLGYEYRSSLHVYYPYPNKEAICDGRDWLPSTNLQQAVDHIVPVLNEMAEETTLLGFPVKHSAPDGAWLLKFAEYEGWYETVGAKGQGSTPSERMAWALCEVFLKVREGGE